MMDPSTLIAFPLGFVVLVYKIGSLIPLLFRWKFSLSEVPGPPLAAWTRFWWLSVLHFGKADEELVGLHKEYGPIVRIAPNTVVVSDPEMTRKILAVGSKYRRGPWFDSLRLDPDKTTVVSERDPKIHQEFRYILGAGLSGKDIVGVEAVVDDQIYRWMRIIYSKQFTSNSRATKVDLSQTIPFLTLDIITRLCLGESFQCLEADEDKYGFLDALQSGMIAHQYLAILLGLKHLLFLIARLTSVRSRLFPNSNNPNGLGRVMKVIQQAVERRIADVSKDDSPRNMLDSFLSRGLTAERATSELLVVLSSGVGATAYAAQGIIRCIIADPHAQRKLQEEIDKIVSSYKYEPVDAVEESVIKQMPYLQSCITEGLRLYPPVSLLRERVVPLEGDVMHGYRIPGGTFVGINSPASKLHPVFGGELEEFRPERWLINDDVQLKQIARQLELVFGYGESKCLGVNIAYTELNKVIFELFRNHSLRFADQRDPWKARGDFVLSDVHVIASARFSRAHCLE